MKKPITNKIDDEDIGPSFYVIEKEGTCEPAELLNKWVVVVHIVGSSRNI